MYLPFRTLTLIAFVVVSITCGLAQGIIINELYNSGSNDEWVELLVVQDSLDLRGWDIRDFTSGGSPSPPLTFSSNALWSAIRKGTLIVVARSENTFSEDTDPSDFLLVVKSSNALYLSGSVFSFAGTSDAVQIRNASATHVFGISWGTANAASLPSPKAHFSPALSSGGAIYFSGGTISDADSVSNWTYDASTSTRGTGNTATNSAWISSLRLSPDGSGSASVRPDTLTHGNATTMTIVYRRDTLFSITDMRVVLPSSFIWSHSVGDISFTNMTATSAIRGDTVYFNTVTMNADSTIIQLHTIIAPDSTAFYTMHVQTKAQTRYRDVGPLPRVVVFGIPVTVVEVKENDANGVPLRIGQLVTLRGVVTVANQFGGPSYIQDNTGGIAIFGSSFSTVVNAGDEVIVTGTLDPFNGLSELTSPYLHAIPTKGNAVTPMTSTCSQLFDDGIGRVEHYECLLVRLNAVVVRDLLNNPISTWAVSGSGTNYRLTDATGAVDIRVDNNVNFANAPAPQGVFDIFGVVSQFKSSLPYAGGYQLMPRFATDIVAGGPVIASLPVESNITATSFRVSWSTANNGVTRLRYGKTTAFELGVFAPDDVQRTNHAVNLTGLQPATIYHVLPFSVANAETSYANDLIVSTASPPQSTGVINIYFNKSVNTGLAWFQQARGNDNFVTRILAHINTARRSIDAALYSLDGTPGNSIASALVNAKNRGVKVRVICEYDRRNSNAFTSLIPNSIPLIDDRYDVINDGAGLHHNKFFVIDARGGAPDSIWVWTGSWNPTDPGTNDDYQNVVEIQDGALAGAYTVEFNEMWGSDTDVPNQSNSRFGARKTDNTPHRFVIGGRDVECYFSPSDRTTSKIISALTGAEHSAAFSLFSFTRSDIAAVLIAKKNAGKKVRGVFDKNLDSFSQHNPLLSAGVDVHLSAGVGLNHHKYAIIDAENPYWNSTTITGSHNWSSAAETSNNENTLVIHDGNIANQFLQEFAARYSQFGGNDTITVSVQQTDELIPKSFSLSQNYPNPFNPATSFRFTIVDRRLTTLKVFDVLGREVATLVNEEKPPGTYAIRWDAGNLASGVYFYRVVAGSYVQQRKMVLLK